MVTMTNLNNLRALMRNQVQDYQGGGFISNKEDSSQLEIVLII